MSLSREEIIDLATRYIPMEEVTDFPTAGDLFCFLQRTLPENKVLEDDAGWAFAGYGVCDGYDYDDDAKPRGKWLWFSFLSLDSFPPGAQHIRLQPPHVAKGRFQTPARDGEIRMIRIDRKTMVVEDTGAKRPDRAGDEPPQSTASASSKKGEILSFPGKK